MVGDTQRWSAMIRDNRRGSAKVWHARRCRESVALAIVVSFEEFWRYLKKSGLWGRKMSRWASDTLFKPYRGARIRQRLPMLPTLTTAEHTRPSPTIADHRRPSPTIRDFEAHISPISSYLVLPNPPECEGGAHLLSTSTHFANQRSRMRMLYSILT